MLAPLSEIVIGFERVDLAPYWQGAVILYSKANTIADLHSHEGAVEVLIQQGTEDALVSLTDGLAISRVANNQSVT